MVPTLTFFGAAGEVTGSCTLLQTDRARVMIDFGLFQGLPVQEERNTIPPDVDFAGIDAVVCTHAHVDHCGRMGMLPKLGYEGRIFCHTATAELLPRVLTSSAKLQAVRLEEYEKGTAPEAVVIDPVPDPAVVALHARTNPPPVLYARGHAERAGRGVTGIAYGVWQEIAPGVRMRLHDAGHIVGSASPELEITHGASRIRVVFSGDLGAAQSGLLSPRGCCPPADVVVMESTRGLRTPGVPHGEFIALEEVVRDAQHGHGMVVMPTFSVGRAQLLLYQLGILSRRGLMQGLPVYLDSPMAARTAELCCAHPELLAPECRDLITRGQSPLDFDELTILWSRKQSQKVAAREEKGLLLAGSGFCDAGPVLHHLQRALPDEANRVVFTGHVLAGSLAHALAHGTARRVRINGMELPVRARVRRVDGFSGHADALQLEEWALGSGHTPDLVVLNHGDTEARQSVRDRLSADIKSDFCTPLFQQVVPLA